MGEVVSLEAHRLKKSSPKPRKIPTLATAGYDCLSFVTTVEGRRRYFVYQLEKVQGRLKMLRRDHEAGMPWAGVFAEDEIRELEADQANLEGLIRELSEVQ